MPRIALLFVLRTLSGCSVTKNTLYPGTAQTPNLQEKGENSRRSHRLPGGMVQKRGWIGLPVADEPSATPASLYLSTSHSEEGCETVWHP